MRKLLRAAAVSFLFALSASACGDVAGAWTRHPRVIEARQMRIAVQPNARYAPLLVAKRKGWLDAELGKVGVAARWSYFVSGPPMSASLAAGEQDIGLMDDAPAILGRASGHQTGIVGIASAMPTVPVGEPSRLAVPGDRKSGVAVIVAARAFASGNPGLVSIFLQVYERGGDWIRENPAEAARLVSREVNRPSAELAKTLTGFDFDPHLHDDDIAALKKTERLLRRAGLIRRPVDMASFLGAGRVRVERIP